MWNAAMARVDGRSVGLDGVVAQQANYARSGFGRVRANARYAGAVPSPVGAAGEPLGVLDAAEVPFTAVEKLDRSFFPAPRPRSCARGCRRRAMPPGSRWTPTESPRATG